ncbi:MAG: TIR domain-containing protein [Erysipelotrichaceae bacterium]|nr:TIR domain-containing protein [Erysipelotrichaceae bacterium]
MESNQKDYLETKLVPGVGRMPYPAYRGKDPYVFVSYAHLDAEKVYPEIRRFNEAGYHVWYDEGIAPGNEWTDEIASALEKCSVFVVMITPTSAPRQNVLNEIYYALDDNKPFLAIHLEETELKGGLRLRIGSKQAIFKYNMTDEEYEFKYIEAFTRFGLKRTDEQPENKTIETKKPDDVSIKKLDEMVKDFLGTNKTVNQKETVSGEEFYDDSPEDARKRANGDLVRIDGFDVEHGFLRKYHGTEKDIVVPPSAKVIGSLAFEGNHFLESVNLNQAGLMIAGKTGVFCNCPNLKTVRIPATVKEVTPDMFQYCPNLTVYVRRSQVSSDFEERFTGKEIVYLDE